MSGFCEVEKEETMINHMIYFPTFNVKYANKVKSNLKFFREKNKVQLPSCISVDTPKLIFC